VVAVRKAVTANVLFRCDASPFIGAGHMMRCLALAETMAAVGFRPHFLSAKGSADVLAAIGRSGFALIEVRDGEDGVASARAAGIGDVRVAVVDGYGLGADIERAFNDIAETVIALEDAPTRRHDAHIVVDPTPERAADAYADLVGPGSIVLTGSAQALIRPLWREVRNRGCPQRGNHIFVSFGATDPSNATARVVEALKLADLDWDVHVVLGASAPHLKDVEARLGARMSLDVDPADFPDLLCQATLAIGAPGSSSLERALLGIPSIVIPVADNQNDIGAALAATGAAEVLPSTVLDDVAALGASIAALAADAPRRSAMAKAAFSLCDGRGALRLLAAIAGTVLAKDGTNVQLRLAEHSDSDWLLALQSQPETRRFARDPDVPSPAGHARWYAAAMADTNRILLLVEKAGVRCGFVRLDRQPSSDRPRFEVSVAVDPSQHGRGIGSAALRLLRRFAPGADFNATVLAANTSSRALFANAGYKQVGPELYWSHPQ
jgi:UDP-2,4-diacetamido-2,4,6-trideoxy-beta-L-altropyranose hydrolase